MRTMKKLFAMLLAVAMICTLAITAAATEPDPTAVAPTALTDTGTITIKGAVSGNQYTVYRIFDVAKVSNGKTVFVVNDKWKAFAEEEQANGYLELSNGYVKLYKKDISTEELEKAEAQAFAKRVVEWAAQNGITFDGQSARLTTSGDYTSPTPYQYGYYVMVSDRDVEETQYTVYVMNSGNVEVREKNVKNATIEKFVQEDSKMSEANGGWGESNAAEIGQDIHFKIIFTAAGGEEPFIIRDSMPNFYGLTQGTVTYSKGKIPENGVNVQATDDGFKVTFGTTFRSLLEDGDTLTFEYTAKLKSDAVIAGTGNVNTVVLDNDDDPTEVLLSDSTTTYTYEMDVNKVDENSALLAGASFQLVKGGEAMKFSKDATDSTKYIVDPAGAVQTIVTDNTGKFSICGLDTEDEYVLTETAAPAGYVLMEPKTIVIHESDNATWGVTVQNLPGVDMPETGGMGTTLFYTLGGLMVFAAAALLVTKKRMGDVA